MVINLRRARADNEIAVENLREACSSDAMQQVRAFIERANPALGQSFNAIYDRLVALPAKFEEVDAELQFAEECVQQISTVNWPPRPQQQ